MPTLRLTQSAVGPDRFRVEAALEGDNLAPQRGHPENTFSLRNLWALCVSAVNLLGKTAYAENVRSSFSDRLQTATVEFDFNVTPQEQEDIRWYLEDYLQHVADPAPKIAARIEGRMAEMGANLFKALFLANDDAHDLWAALRDRLNDTRVEITTGVLEATALPWELLRDPKTDTPVALRANAFVRAARQVAQRPHLLQNTSGSIRILLVICRPGGGDDVPFRSVASRLIKGLSESAREAFQFDVLRPPTFEQLGKVLAAAKKAGEPYHVVHFDGHGAYVDLYSDGPSQSRTRKRGYVAFENPAFQSNVELVHGTLLGRLLAETEVPILVLNACRSAHAEAPAAPARAPTAIEQTGSPPTPAHSTSNSEATTQVRAFGSLAQEVVDAGVAGVVAMRYNVYVVTAAQFVADLYEALASGQSLGEAVSAGRKHLETHPLREIAYQPRPLQDWTVPIVFEALPVALFPKPAGKAGLKISVTADAAARSPGQLDPQLERPPDVGFFGRDETLLALDRAFDRDSVVMLHAYAGSGKTSTAAEFARWYSLTGGVEGPVLFTSFELYVPLARVLDQIGQGFEPSLESAGVKWLALTDDQRRDMALQVLKQIPVLWIWDNVEPVAGFPAGAQSSWSAAEQEELAAFLRASQETKAKFLLTSRRDERLWLGDLPVRVMLPDMWMQERVQLARALAEKYGQRLIDVDEWLPLLEFTQGNPMTLTVLVGQALRDGLKTKEQIEAFVGKLQAGESAFEDEAGEGRSKSLGASLSYGFDHAFSEDEGKQLALLHFFQGFVAVGALRAMGDPDIGDLPEVRGMTDAAGIALLDRAAEIGLLTSYGGGFYTIHPAVPWFLKRLFDRYHPANSNTKEGPSLKASRAFAEMMGRLGDFSAKQYMDGNSKVIDGLTLDESNLLYARHLARAHRLWASIRGTMQGLRFLYKHTGRNVEWARLVDETVLDFVDPDTDGPLPGREDEWSIITQYRVDLALEARRWSEAERLQGLRINWDRQRAALALTIPRHKLDNEQQNRLRTLATSLAGLGQIQSDLSQPNCAQSYEESLKLAEKIGDRPGAAICALNLGKVYLEIPALRNLTRAERWARRSLKMWEENEQLYRAQCLYVLSQVAWKRFLKVRDSKRSKGETPRHLGDALQFCIQALQLAPPDAVEILSAIHNQLGRIYSAAGADDLALEHFHECIRYNETENDIFAAANARNNVAAMLVSTGRLADAREYAYAALRNFETYGDSAAEEIQQTRELIESIELRMILQGG